MADKLLDIDRNLADDVVFVMGTKPEAGPGHSRAGVMIEFQFPPKILNDSRTGKWFETEVPGNQPMAVWDVSGARKWSLEWTYIIGARGWDTQRVRNQITNLRAYWTERESLASNFIVFFKIWKLGGSDEMTCRLTNIDITHGKALYIPSTGLSAPSATQRALAHPVITNIKVAMQLWTEGGADDEYKTGAGFQAGAQKAVEIARTNASNKLNNTKNEAGKFEVPGLAPGVKIGWQ